MSLNDHKITSFAKPVSALADKPKMTAAELKAWFDSNSTNEVKNAVNGIIDALTAAGGAAQIGTTGGNVQVELDKRVTFEGAAVKFIRLNSDNVLETSADGVSWQTTAAGGHAVVDSGGTVLPQRGRVRFENAEVTDRNGETVVRAVRSGENLLDNWYFADPINQRGATEKTDFGYFIDRWLVNTTTASLVNGLVIAPTSYSNNLLQYIEPEVWDALVGKTVTLSFLVSEISGVWNIASHNTVIGTVSEPSVASVTYTIPDGIADSNKFVAFCGGAGTSVTLKAAKLELGTHQTLAHQDADGNWVLNDPPPNKQQELAKCQRYFRKCVWSVATKQNGDYWSVAYDATAMRETPTCTIEKLCYIGNYNRDPGETDFMTTDSVFGSVLLFAYLPSQKSMYPDSTSCGIMFTLDADL